MIKINRIKNSNNVDLLFPDTFFIIDDSKPLDKIIFFQAGSGDLYFSCYSKNKEISLIIDESNFLLYKIVEELYINLTTGKFILTNLFLNELSISELLNDNKKIMKELSLSNKVDLNNIYNGKYVSWESDASFNECSNEELQYNYLNLYKINDKYVFKFINNSNESSFNINFNTDRSKYGPFVYAFSIFLKRLEIITEEKNKKYIKKEK